MKAYNLKGAQLITGAGGGGGGSFSAGMSNLGNTGGTSGMVSDRLVLVGSNNITLSQSVNAGSATVSIFGPSGGGLTNINISAGTTSNNLSNLVFSNSNGLSFGLNGSTITGSHNGLTSQSNQAFSAGGVSSAFETLVFQDSNGISFSNNVGSIRLTHELQFTSNTSVITSNALHSSAARVINIVAATNNTGGGTASLSSNVSFSAANGLTFYTSAGNAIVGSYSVPTVTNSSMTVSDAATSGTLARLAFTNLNGVTLSLSTGAGGSHTIVGSHNALTSQSNQAFSAGAASSAFQTLVFQDSNGISFSNNAGSIRLTHGLMFSSQSVMSVYAVSNTTQSSSGTVPFSAHSFAGAGVALVGVSNGSVVISVPAGGGGLTNINVSAGTTSNNLSNVVFSNSNGVSFGLNGSTITASVNAGAGGVAVGVSTGGHTAGNTGTFSSGTIVLAGSSSLTLSQSTGGAGVHTIWLQPAMSQLTAGANITLSTTGSTISIIGAGGGGATVGGYHPYDDFVQVVGQVGQGTLQVDPQVLPNVSFDRLVFYLQHSNATNSSGSQTLSFWVGLYTRTSNSLSRYTSWSVSTALTQSGTVGSYSLYSGGRAFPLTLAAATSISGDRYWIAFLSRTTSGGANASFSNYLISNINSQYTGLFGAASNASMQPKLGQGYYSATTSGMPNAIAFADLQGTNSAARRFPVVGFGTSTY